MHLTSTTFIVAVIDGSGLALFAAGLQMKGVVSQPSRVEDGFVMV